MSHLMLLTAHSRTTLPHPLAHCLAIVVYIMYKQFRHPSSLLLLSIGDEIHKIDGRLIGMECSISRMRKRFIIPLPSTSSIITLSCSAYCGTVHYMARSSGISQPLFVSKCSFILRQTVGLVPPSSMSYEACLHSLSGFTFLVSSFPRHSHAFQCVLTESIGRFNLIVLTEPRRNTPKRFTCLWPGVCFRLSISYTDCLGLCSVPGSSLSSCEFIELWRLFVEERK